jgi:hypothetical protein
MKFNIAPSKDPPGLNKSFAFKKSPSKDPPGL